MAERGHRRTADRLDTPTVLRVLRFEPGDRRTIRTLSRNILGLFTHYKGRSHYCPGAEQCEYHKLPQIWKGYEAVEEWEQESCLWLPVVLEVTEGLELDFRGRYDRGQVWELHRHVATKKNKGTPLRGRLLEERDPATFPTEFDFRNVLINLYHCVEIRLDKKNPMPPRVLLKPSTGEAPRDPDKPASSNKPASPEDIRLLQERMRLFNGTASRESDKH